VLRHDRNPMKLVKSAATTNPVITLSLSKASMAVARCSGRG
jgi:hypothetical protein